ncbi:hypothetical protein JCM5350_006343 [Sporobolomyces pararoseus]
MPAKRTADEIGRPPLSRGSACHRCFKRKVRCSPPEPDSGIHACSSCLRTARFKNHDLNLVRCAFNNEGLCSEEGGLQMNGEPLPASAGPTRRKLGSRTSTSSSNRSNSSRASSSSSIRSDISNATSPSSSENVSPASSLESVPTIRKLESELPQPPPQFERYPSPSYHLPLPPAPSAYFTNLCERPPLELQASISMSIPSSVSSSARCSRQGSPITPTDSPMPLFARRSRQIEPMQISLPRNNHSRHSPSASISTVAPSLDSAPLQTPASWQQYPLPSLSSLPYTGQQQYPPLPVQIPHTQLALDLAPFSALSPSALSKFNATSASSFDFYCSPPSIASDQQYPATVGAALGMDHYSASFDIPATSYVPSNAAQYPSQAYNYQYSLGPATPFRNVDAFSLDNSSLQHFDLSLFGGSFHLPSPGVTFTSSNPSRVPNPQYFCT